MLTTKMQDELVALLVKARRQNSASTGSRVASGASTPPGSGPVALPPHTNKGHQQTAPTNGAESSAAGARVNGNASNGPVGK
jgi:hypothetical protein